MLKSCNSIQSEDVEGLEILVESHRLGKDDKVLVTIQDEVITVNGYELIKAIENSLNI